LLTAQTAAPAPSSTKGATAGASKASTVPAKLPKLWRSEATKHDFRVEVTNDTFKAEWVNIPPVPAKQGAYIRTECRRAGAKWVGTSKLNMLFAVPNAPPGKDLKLCELTVRFEVDSISPAKIAGYSEKLTDFDVNSCKVRNSKWAEFTWTPKK
jgi:hypothetical protein